MYFIKKHNKKKKKVGDFGLQLRLAFVVPTSVNITVVRKINLLSKS